jgi:hypothetical protein
VPRGGEVKEIGESRFEGRYHFAVLVIISAIPRRRKTYIYGCIAKRKRGIYKNMAAYTAPL